MMIISMIENIAAGSVLDSAVGIAICRIKEEYKGSTVFF
jgi:hypothetical protein